MFANLVGWVQAFGGTVCRIRRDKARSILRLGIRVKATALGVKRALNLLGGVVASGILIFPDSFNLTGRDDN